MDKFLISFSLKDNGAEYIMTLRGSGFEYEEIPITINEYNSFMDFKKPRVSVRTKTEDCMHGIFCRKKQSDIPERIKGYIRQAFGDVSLGYAVLDDIVSKLKRGKFDLQIPGGGIKECDGWYIYEKNN